MRKKTLMPVLLALLTSGGALLAQTQEGPWTAEQLEAEMQGFLPEGEGGDTRSVLHQVSALLKQQKMAFFAICDRIHGNYAEYLLRIEKLLGELTDERWEARERAEKTLKEIGGKARDLISARAQSAPTVEERIRSGRAHAFILNEDDGKEMLEARYIRGLVTTALYMNPHKKLTRALVSALQHTDPLIVEGCIRSLGRHGGDVEATRLIERMKVQGEAHRLATLAALARMQGAVGATHVEKLLLAGKLDDTMAMLMLRILRERPDSKAALARLAKSTHPLLAKTAKLELPSQESGPQLVRIALGDLTILEGSFLGFAGDCLRLGKPAVVDDNGLDPIGMPEHLFSLSHCDSIRFVKVEPAVEKDLCRLYLVQGSLVTGILVGIDRLMVTLESKTFGRLQVPRTEVQGLAIDPKLDRLLGASTKHDKLRLRDNSSVSCDVQAMDSQGVTIEDLEGNKQAVVIEKVAGLLFKRPLQQQMDNRTYTRISLANGDRLLCHLVAINKSHVGALLPGVGTATIPLAEVVDLEFGLGGGAMWGFTLVADYSDNRIVEFDDQGKEVFSIEEIFGVWDVECLDNGNLLITEFSVNKVSEITRKNEPVWSYDDLKNPYDADRLPNGNTLIADTFGRRVIEVDKAGKIVWKYDVDIHPYDVDRLPNGNTLIADSHGDRVIEIDKKGTIVWKITDVPNLHDADRLPNGNTLLTIRMLNLVREVDPAGKVIMEIKDLHSPSDADRLPNGNTMVAENGMVRTFDRHGNEVMRIEITWAVEVNHY